MTVPNASIILLRVQLIRVSSSLLVKKRFNPTIFLLTGWLSDFISPFVVTTSLKIACYKFLRCTKMMLSPLFSLIKRIIFQKYTTIKCLKISWPKNEIGISLDQHVNEYKGFLLKTTAINIQTPQRRKDETRTATLNPATTFIL